MKISKTTSVRFTISLLFIALLVSGCSSSNDVPDPMVQNRTQVDFEITVPMYQSDALQVRLIWGDVDLNANWVGDEFWSASADLLTNTEHALYVTFYDNNGALELAGFEQTYHTGTNASEIYTVTVDQFDANQFDTDGDGFNNLDEMILGTDPLIYGDSHVEIRDDFWLNDMSRMSVSRSFESRLSVQRPFFYTFEENIESDFDHRIESTSTNIDIDAEGNGTLTHNESYGIENVRFTGIRTRSDNSISWESERGAFDGDYMHNVNISNTVVIVDENTRNFIEEVVGSNSGLYHDRWETSSNLTGKLIDGTSFCKPVAGTVSTTNRTNRGNLLGVSTVTIISKLIDDPYWRVVEVENNTGPNDTETIETTEYFVRELKIRRRDEFFICDFVDL